MTPGSAACQVIFRLQRPVERQSQRHNPQPAAKTTAAESSQPDPRLMKRRRAQPQVSISIRAGAKISGLRDEKLPFAGNAFQSVSSHVFEFDAGHHRANVVGALFEGGHFHWPIGKPGASLVESDQAAKSAEPLEEERTARNLPVEIEVRHGSWRHDQVDGTVARDLVGDQHIVTTGVITGSAARSVRRGSQISATARPIAHRLGFPTDNQVWTKR